MTLYAGFPEPLIVTVVYLLIGAPGLYLALRWLREDAAQQWRDGHPGQVRVAFGLVFAVLIAAVTLSASQMLDPCSETALRTVWGDWWETGWWVMGCYLMP